MGLSSGWCTEPNLPSVMWHEEENGEVEITAEHGTPQKPKHCSRFLPPALSCHHTPCQATTHAQGTTKLPSRTGYQTCKPKARYAIIHSKAATTSRSRAFPGHPSLDFLPNREAKKQLPSSGPPGKTTSSLGQPHCSWLCPLTPLSLLSPHHPRHTKGAPEALSRHTPHLHQEKKHPRPRAATSLQFVTS